MERSDMVDPMVTKRSLLLRLQAGGAARELAWEEFDAKYSPIIRGFARKTGALIQDLPDLVQDVFAGFFAASPKFQYDANKGRFRGYLKVCTWRVLQAQRNKKLHLGGRYAASIEPDDVAVEHAWNDVWEAEKLRKALEIVRKDYEARPERAKTFQAFNLYVLLERSAEDVAAELGLNVASVHQAKKRITQAIKVAMQELDDMIN